jgi:hypothetical protein
MRPSGFRSKYGYLGKLTKDITGSATESFPHSFGAETTFAEEETSPPVCYRIDISEAELVCVSDAKGALPGCLKRTEKSALALKSFAQL